MQIVVCDPDCNFSNYLTQILYKVSRNINILTFSDADLCFKFLKKNNADLLITDSILHPYNGINLAKKIRESHIEIKIMFISSVNYYATESYEVKAIDFILKSIDERRLILKLKNILF